jgi:hypothetical protein
MSLCQQNNNIVKFVVPMSVTMTNTILFGLSPCRLVEVYLHSVGTYRLYFHLRKLNWTSEEQEITIRIDSDTSIPNTSSSVPETQSHIPEEWTIFLRPKSNSINTFHYSYIEESSFVKYPQHRKKDSKAVSAEWYYKITSKYGKI